MKARRAEKKIPPVSDDEVVAALMQPMLGAPLFVIWSTAGSQPQLIRRHLLEHLRYMIELERKGVLFASGPFGEDSRPGDGLTIIRAKDIAAATAVAEEDPFVRHQARTFLIRAWTVNEGSISVTFRFSDQTMRFA